MIGEAGRGLWDEASEMGEACCCSVYVPEREVSKKRMFSQADVCGWDEAMIVLRVCLV